MNANYSTSICSCGVILGNILLHFRNSFRVIKSMSKKKGVSVALSSTHHGFFRDITVALVIEAVDAKSAFYD